MLIFDLVPGSFTGVRPNQKRLAGKTDKPFLMIEKIHSTSKSVLLAGLQREEMMMSMDREIIHFVDFGAKLSALPQYHNITGVKKMADCNGWPQCTIGIEFSARIKMSSV